VGCECTHLRRGEFLLHISTFALSRTGQEREDDTECYTQIFLEPDGTVRFGATDGPPPEDACGLWQCGSKGFQMILTRKFEVTGSLKGLTYSVSRVYLGSVNEASKDGLQMIDGRMELFDSTKDYTGVDDTNAVAVSNVWGGEVLGTAVLSTPIGYFSIDGGPAVQRDLRGDDDK